MSSSSRVLAERHERLFLLERHVSGARRIPRSAVPSFERLRRARAVDGQLQCAIAVRRPSQLVVHDTQRAVLEKIDAIRLRPDRDLPRRAARGEFERVPQLVLEQAFDHRRVLLDLERERALGKAGRRGGSEQQRALERPIAFGEPASRPSAILRTASIASRDIRRRDRAVPAPLPLDEEVLEDFVDELAAFLRRHPGLLVTLLRELQHVGGKVLERAVQVALDVADGVRRG